MDKVVHFEIPADDLARANKFYTDVFGWEVKDSGMPGMEYLMATTVATDERMTPKEPGAINGGLMKRQSPKESSVIVINVKNLDQSLAKATSMGGQVVMPKMTVGNMGLYARVTDSEGNVIGLWEDIPSAHH